MKLPDFEIAPMATADLANRLLPKSPVCIRLPSKSGLLRGVLMVAGAALLLAGCGQSPIPSAEASQTATSGAPTPVLLTAPAKTGAAVVAPSAADLSTTEVTTTGAAQSRIQSMSVDQLLAAARDAMSRQNLIAPATDNAFEYYEAVLRKDPKNLSAADALRETFPFGAIQVEHLIDQKNFDEADREMALLATADPGNYTLILLRSKLDAAKKQTGRAITQITTQAADGTQHVLNLSASATSWVDVVDANSNKLYSGVLHAGQQVSYRSTRRLGVTLGNADSVTMSLDGKPVPLALYRHEDKVVHLNVFVAPTSLI